MYRRILVPVDGSSTSKLGLEHALRLAGEQGALVRVLNVLDDAYMLPALDGYPVGDISFLLESAKAAAEKVLAEAVALAERKHVAVEKALVESRGRFVSDVILAHSKKWRADIIVMGTHGRRGLSRLLLGSDAERVLRETSVPVLLVRGPTGRRRSADGGGAKPRTRTAARRPAARTLAAAA